MGYHMQQRPDEGNQRWKRGERSDGSSAAHGSVSWVKGPAPLKQILLLWNGVALLGPVAFQTTEERDAYTKNMIDLTATVSPIAGAPTHYLIIPKCE